MQSLLIIDEIENSLHPQAQRRLVKHLIRVCLKKKLQIILSTHSQYILEEIPQEARILLMQLADDKKDILYGASTNFALSSIDEIEHPDMFIFVEDKEAEILFWEILKFDEEQFAILSKKLCVKIVGSCSVLKSLDGLAKGRKLPYHSLCIADGDVADAKTCIHLPCNFAPEKQIFCDLKKENWSSLDSRFGIGAGTLFKILDDAIISGDHHSWTAYVGDRIKKSKDDVWSILAAEWCRTILSEEKKKKFINLILEKLESLENN